MHYATLITLVGQLAGLDPAQAERATEA
ncbi:MAG: hypothetical protein QOD24_366, partial [Solirubrobacteraceae bacterium]|nr:hypothetical protein [Solirubrobacteraceae bacterium]